MIILDAGSVFSFGENKFGACGVGNTHAVIHTPGKVSSTIYKLNLNCFGYLDVRACP